MSDYPTTADCERAFIGAVLHADAQTAIEQIGTISASDFEDPVLRVILEAAGAAARAGTAPDPVVTLDAVRNGAADLDANKLQLVSRALVKVYEECPHPGGIAKYAELVVAGALRRAVREVGQRLDQIADTSPLDDLRATVTEQFVSLFDLFARLDRIAPQPAKSEAST